MKNIFKKLGFFKTPYRDGVEAAIDVIELYGMKAHYYISGSKHRDNRKLSNALDELAASGFLITDSEGALVGKVATKRLDSNSRAEQRRAEFRIVTDKESPQ